jgi:hypothetical protein
MRVEQKRDDDRWYVTDTPQPLQISRLPRVKISEELSFVSLPTPYQGMYLLDRELMLEHLGGPSSHPDFGPWRIREKAAQGVTFAKVPAGFYARNVFPYQAKARRIDPRCLIHHLPNSYANSTDPENPFAKTPYDELLVGDL